MAGVLALKHPSLQEVLSYSKHLHVSSVDKQIGLTCFFHS